MSERSVVSSRLSSTELRRLARRERDPRVRVRLLLIAHLVDGMTPREAAHAVGLSHQPAYEWLKRYNAEGLAGLADRKRSGRRRLLDSDKEAAFKARIAAGAAVERDGVTAFRGPDAQRILREEFGAAYSLSGTYTLMHRLGLSWLDVRPRHPAGDARQQGEFRQLLRYNLSESRRRKHAANESRSGSRMRPGLARRTA